MWKRVPKNHFPYFTTPQSDCTHATSSETLANSHPRSLLFCWNLATAAPVWDDPKAKYPTTWRFWGRRLLSRRQGAVHALPTPPCPPRSLAPVEVARRRVGVVGNGWSSLPREGRQPRPSSSTSTGAARAKVAALAAPDIGLARAESTKEAPSRATTSVSPKAGAATTAGRGGARA